MTAASPQAQDSSPATPETQDFPLTRTLKPAFLNMPDTPVENSIFHIIHCYHLYAAREGDVDTLSLDELNALLTENMPRFMEGLGRSQPEYLKQLFQVADKDKDNQICFDEFIYIVGKVMKDYHLQYHRQLCAHYCQANGLY